MDRETLIKHFVSQEFNRFLDYYRNAPDLNVTAEKDRREPFDKNMSCVFINIGKTDGVEAKDLVHLLQDIAGKELKIGLIEVNRNFTLVDLDPKQVQRIIAALNNDIYVGERKVQARLDRKSKSAGANRDGKTGRRGYAGRRRSSDFKRRRGGRRS